MACTFSRSSSARAGAHAGLLVVVRADPTVEERRGRWLAEVVAHRAEHHGHFRPPGQIVDAAARLVDHHQRVRPDVAFRVPFRLLPAPDERLHLRQQAPDDAQCRARTRSRWTAAQRAEAVSRPRPRCVPPAGRRAGSRGRSRLFRGEPTARTGRRTASPAARAGCRQRTSRDRRRGGCGPRDRRGRRGGRGTRQTTGPTRWR